MLSDLIDLIFPNGSPWVDAIQTWIDTLISSSQTPLTDPTTGEYVSQAITSVNFGASLIPWDNICSCVVLCVFIVCLFKFMRSVFCKQF